MSDQHPTEGASTSRVSDSALELNIKTLDSRTYNFQVNNNMLVSSFKGKIADQIGIPVGQQRLIFRGKVLKDDHLLSDYYVENGDTLHLVERQTPQPQVPSGTGNADTSVNNGAQGNDGGAGAPRNRIGHISHSVVLGTFNVGDQGESGANDLSRVVGAVLNSLGVGNQNTSNAAAVQNATVQNAPLQNSSGQQGGDAEQEHNGTGSQSQAGGQAQFGHPFLNQPFHVPFTGASIPPPSLNVPLTDSLNTLSEFVTRMQRALSQNGFLSATSSIGTTDQPATTELPSNSQGLPTPEALSIVLRQVERLLSGPAAASLSHIAGRLEQEADSTDNSVRNEIQTESAQVGLAMQHLGALFLELGRTILMLRMGQSPAEGVVNAGHAVYISQSGPNPIMVQPFPHQASPLFNPPAVSPPAVSPPTTGTMSPVGIVGSTPRHINIHIHAGSSLAPMVSAVGGRAATEAIAQGENNGRTASGDSGPTQEMPVRNVVAAAIPRSATIAVSPVPIMSQSGGGVSASQLPDGTSLSSAISQVNSHIRNLLGNMRTDNPTPSGQQDNSPIPNSSTGLSGSSASATEPSQSIHSESRREASDTCSDMLPELQTEEDQTERQEPAKLNDESSYVTEPSSICKSDEVVGNSDCDRNEAEKSCHVDDKPAGVQDIPLGLGGGLQPKRQNRQSKMQLKSGEGGASGSPGPNLHARSTGQQILQSLVSQSIAGMPSSNDATSGRVEHRQASPDTEVGSHGSDGQFDVTGMMSQLIDSPALNGLLSGVSQQAGVGSPDALRNMLQQFTQNPAMRNTVNQLARQIDTEDSSQGRNFDFSSLMQQMMPVVSQVLGGGSAVSEQGLMPELQPQYGDRRLSGVDRSHDQLSQNNLHEVVQRIAQQDAPQNIFQSVAHSAAESSGTTEAELVNGLCGNEDLADQFVEMLRNDLRHQLQGGGKNY